MFQGVTTTEYIVFSPDTVSDLAVAGKRPAFGARLNHQTTQNANKAGLSLYAGWNERSIAMSRVQPRSRGSCFGQSWTKTQRGGPWTGLTGRHCIRTVSPA